MIDITIPLEYRATIARSYEQVSANLKWIVVSQSTSWAHGDQPRVPSLVHILQYLADVSDIFCPISGQTINVDKTKIIAIKTIQPRHYARFQNYGPNIAENIKSTLIDWELSLHTLNEK
mgnify:CR=1 FL=1